MKNVLLFCILTLTSLNAFSQESLDMNQVLHKVKSYNQDLKLKKMEIKAARLQKREALGQALPQLSAEVNHAQNFDVPVFNIPGQGRLQLQGDYEMTYSGQVNQALYTFGAIGAAVKAARSGIDMYKKDVIATELQVEYEAKVAFFQVLFMQRNLKINESLLRNAEENYRLLTRNFRGGRPPQGDVLRLQADIETKKPMVDNAKAQLRAAKFALNILMGEEPNKDFNVVGNLNAKFPILSGPILRQASIKESPALKVLEKSAEYQDHLADVQWSSQMPQLSLYYQFNKNDQSYSDRFATDRTLKTQAIGLSLRWNLWDGGISRASYQRAKVNASKMDYELQKAKDQLSQQVLTSLEQFKTYKSNVASLERAVFLARKSHALSQKRFSSGRTSITELNDTQSALLQAEIQQANNLFQLNSSFALLETLVGKDLK